MNIHQIFVHFPIALLTVYAVLECVRTKRLLSNSSFKNFKAFLVIVGTLAAYVAAFTGDMAEELVRSNAAIRPVLELHSTFAVLTQVVFSIIAAAYIASIITKEWRRIPVLSSLAEFIQCGPLIVLLSLGGLVLITITGALGGMMVYGSSVDPVVSLVAHIFSIQI